MRRRTWTPALMAVACVGACSVLNSTETLKPVDEAAGAAGSKPSTGGSPAAGGKTSPDPGGSGGEVPIGGCGSECVEGGAPPIGRDCTDSAADCGSTAPICDAVSGECRACAADAECGAETGRDYCVESGIGAGRCVACRGDDECSGKAPVCSATGMCRGCTADDECASGVCEPNGACGLPASAVYALAETGLGGPNCGTQDTPCRNLSDATSKLTLARNTLVLQKTPKAYTTGAAFPAIKGLRVIGNGNTVKPFDGASAFIVPPGAAVAFDNVVLAGAIDSGSGGISCTGAAIGVSNSTLQENATGVLASDCDVVIAQSLFTKNTEGLGATCTVEHCDKVTTVSRSKFVDNSVALYFSNQANATVENNLFLRNGSADYTRVLELRADMTRVAYNTLVQNYNNCVFVGIVACIGGCNNVGNISYDNFPGQESDCLTQVWYGGTLSYNLTEVAYPGSTNKIGDPKFVDAANGDFTPGPGSPAIDKGNPDDAPALDLNGTKRPKGAAPDIGAIEAQ